MLLPTNKLAPVQESETKMKGLGAAFGTNHDLKPP